MPGSQVWDSEMTKITHFRMDHTEADGTMSVFSRDTFEEQQTETINEVISDSSRQLDTIRWLFLVLLSEISLTQIMHTWP